MNPQHLQKDFLPKELVLRLVRDIPRENYAEKISLLNKYINEVKDTTDPDVLTVRANNEMGFIYWDAGQYEPAVRHYEKVLEVLAPPDYPFLYFHVSCMLIRCCRLIKQFELSMKWAENTLDKLDHTDSGFEKLNVLGEYADLLTGSGTPFNTKHLPVIDSIIRDLEFPETPADDPVQRINLLRALNKKWNRKLGSMHLADPEKKEELIAALKDYAASCEIGWYKKYAEKRLHEMVNAG
ncbi:MAG: hypothetical protein FD123_3731 [Bacteroidetes bacterium]|nr:MAG: hypothetical protein FD123_3731 [Bacteroidota bacterium]